MDQPTKTSNYSALFVPVGTTEFRQVVHGLQRGQGIARPSGTVESSGKPIHFLAQIQSSRWDEYGFDDRTQAVNDLPKLNRPAGTKQAEPLQKQNETLRKFVATGN
ncbi:MAG: hypothetical protein JST85_07830 [Acidobacteria bacterium]|nr:hypothetical protein [Acidobacteriota bacterium]